ncbi:MAG: DNA alkylation repair protein [Oscillospiraceae bacterium]|nr:DNA alkylation repair protein [Oscillospiraceae bacterium]
MNRDEIIEKLFSAQDTEYRELLIRLLAGVPADCVIGVRTPVLKDMAKDLCKTQDITWFLDSLPHRYFEENQLHAFIVSRIKDMHSCLSRTEEFLPYIDNWATCDQFSPSVFSRNRDLLLSRIPEWLSSGRTYTVRFGIDMLMRHFLDDRFDPSQAEMVAALQDDEYYVNMASAWYFATALAKQYDSVIGFLTENRLSGWVHNKSIQKAIESRRITEEQKTFLKTLRK